jgi:hypothetical protein
MPFIHSCALGLSPGTQFQRHHVFRFAGMDAREEGPAARRST